jgi:hypothetical protein
MNRYRILIVTLIVLPLALVAYRIISFGDTVLPMPTEKVWRVVMETHLSAERGEISAKISLPSRRQGIIVLDEKMTEGPLDFNLVTEGLNRYGVWSGRAGAEEVPISYSSTFVIRPRRFTAERPRTPGFLPEGVSTEEQALADRLVSNMKQLPPLSMLEMIAQAAAGRLEASLQSRTDADKWIALHKKLGNTDAALVLLQAAKINAHRIEGLILEDSVTTKTAVWIGVLLEQRWYLLKPDTGEFSDKFPVRLPLARDAGPTVQALKGKVDNIRWSIDRQVISQWNIQYARIKESARLLDRWSLFRLPPENQRIFRILILVPLGALMICVLRNIVGFPTFGIFMPVLMALAFRSTGLFYGLIIFAGVIGIGYAARRAIDNLRLLLVPRLSVILTFVIACFIFFAIVGNKLNMKEFMAIGLLPFVILTMTIERFHVIIEEQGTREAFRTAAGSAAVAVITFVIIQFEPLQLAFFVYPELMFIVMAGQALIGRYTGFRLMELVRFRQLGRIHEDKSI